MLYMDAERGLPYSNTGDIGVWLKIWGATIFPDVFVPGCTIVVTESHDLGFVYMYFLVYQSLVSREE